MELINFYASVPTTDSDYVVRVLETNACNARKVLPVLVKRGIDAKWTYLRVNLDIVSS